MEYIVYFLMKFEFNRDFKRLKCNTGCVFLFKVSGFRLFLGCVKHNILSFYENVNTIVV
jgi:hypothetical protein